MSSNRAPRNGRDTGQTDQPQRTVVPAADGVAPAPSTAGRIDWSGDAQAAAVGRMVEAAGRFDELAAQLVESIIRAIETDACETTLGAPVEVVLSQTCRAVGFERGLPARPGGGDDRGARFPDHPDYRGGRDAVRRASK